MNRLMDFFSGFNIQTILAMTAILWYFTRDIRNEIKKEIEEIRKENTVQANRIDNQSKRSDRLYEMFIELLKEKNKENSK